MVIRVGIFERVALTLVLSGCGCCQSEPRASTLKTPSAVTATVASPAATSPPILKGDQQAGALEVLALELHAPGAELETPCSDDGCEHPLTAFFAALEADPPASATVRVVALGNSLIATDGVVRVVRDRLAERLGDGGRGHLLADRLGPWGPRVRTGVAKGRWGLSTVGMLQPLEFPHGLSGAQHQALSAGASTSFDLNGETRAEILWAAVRQEVELTVEIDGHWVSSFARRLEDNVQRSQLALPFAARQLRLTFDLPGAIVQGVVLERTRGIVLDTFGVPSVDATLYLRTDETLFVEQLRARAPVLVMVMLGGNEVKRLAWGRTTLETVEKDLRALLGRIRLAVPQSSCLVVSPIDSVRGPTARVPFEQRPQLQKYLLLQRRLALEEQCAYFDLFTAMGGSGSIKRFAARSLIHLDLVHPRGRGLDLLGELTAAALLRAYDRHSGAN